MKINEIKHGFKLLSVERVDDINSTLYQYEHLKSGGKVAYIENDDTNCCFAAAFRTVPEDSTGVCHIIEHSTLCGSKKYPLKEPFVNLLKTSLNTFLNAFTAYDWTAYPFASQAPKDFDNILSIYLDAVYNPLCMVDPKPFLQEGWHLELMDVNDTPSYKGVVYNEMKGAMSSVDEVLTQATNEAMYKDSPYRHNSGGEPDDIPNLTYEQYKDFYHRHYTPQNSLAYFYGKLNIEEKLEFLDREYYSKFEKQDKEIVILPQKPFINLDYEKDYEIGEDEELKDNTYMSLCYSLCEYKDRETLLAFSILLDALLSKNSSPVKKVMLDAHLGQDVDCMIDDDNVVPALHIYLQKTNHDKKEKFKELFEDAIKEQVKNGIDKDLLLASINNFEFKDKEFDMGRMPKGLIIGMGIFGSFMYNGDLKTNLEFSKYYDKYRKELNNGYFEKLLDKYILHSNHHVEVVINPSKTLTAKKKELMDAKMQHLKETMTLDEKKALVKQTKELLAYQNHVDTKAELATLPKLKLKDVPSNINSLDTKKLRVNGINGFYHELDTNHIGYLKLYFDVSGLKIEDLPYLLLLRSLLLNSRTAKYDNAKLTKLIKTYLGDLSFGQLVMSKTKDDFKYYFTARASALEANVDYIPEFLNEVMLHTRFSKKETETIIKQITTSLRQGLIENGMNVAMSSIRSHYSLESYLTSISMSGPAVYEFYSNLAKNFNFTEVNEKLKEIKKVLFNKSNALISLSGNKETLDALKNATRKLKLPRKAYDNLLEVKIPEFKNEALVIPASINYNALGNNLDSIGLGDNFNIGKVIVLTQIVNYDYLWPEVRVKGGAYGCRLNITRNKDFVFGSYRDPNVVNTYKAYENIINYLRNFKVSKDEFVSYIIGACSGFDTPLSNPALINAWDINYMTGYTKKQKLQDKKDVLKTKQEDIVAFADVFAKVLQNASKYTIGSEAKINEYNFDKVNKLN